MPADYLMLGLEPGADDEQIRRRYLELVKAHPPEKDAPRFQDISRAYERIKNRRARVRQRLFGYREATDVENSLAYLARAARPTRRRTGLQALLEAVREPEAR